MKLPSHAFAAFSFIADDYRDTSLMRNTHHPRFTIGPLA
jgi:hypothetical protein